MVNVLNRFGGGIVGIPHVEVPKTKQFVGAFNTMAQRGRKAVPATKRAKVSAFTLGR